MLIIIPLSFLIISCGNDNSVPGGSGLIESTEVIVSAETAGQLKAIYFDEGDDINGGDTICMIDTVTVTLRLRQAKALREASLIQLDISKINIEQAAVNLLLAKKEYERVKSLIKSGSVNQQQYDKTETAHNSASLAEKQALASKAAIEADLKRTDAEIALLEKQFRDCFPVAPGSGVVTDKFIDVGELAGIGKSLIKIAQLDTVWVKVYVPASDLTAIELGDNAEIDPEDGHSQPLHGTVTWISTEAEFTPKNVQTREARANLVYAVKISIPNPGRILKIGMPVFAKIK